MQKLFNKLQQRWYCRGGYYEFLKIVLPLIISTGAWALQNFIDRIFLAWHSQEAFAAALPAGVLSFSVMSIFVGTISYIDVFVSQYYGKKEYGAIGNAVWQSFYLSFAGAFIMLLFAFFSEEIFTFIGHTPLVIAEEVKYFRLLSYGAFPSLASAALSGFYAGMGKTKTVLKVNLVGIFVNIVFDYLLIFGKFGFPKLGIEGAALASIIAFCAMLVIFVLMLTSSKNNKIYKTRNLLPNFKFIKRLFRFGFPNGVEMFFDMSGFTFFVLIIGTLGNFELSAANMALNINHLAYMPLVGTGIATSILVGQYLGKNEPDIAEKSVFSALHILYFYLACVFLAFLFIPDVFIYPFSKGAESEIIEQLRPTVIILLRFVAVYSVFDGANVLFAAAIKGAGDTAFVMKALILISIFVAALPVYVIISVLKLGLYAGWSVMIAYSVALALAFYLRYKTYKWKKMRVIEMKTADIR